MDGNAEQKKGNFLNKNRAVVDWILIAIIIGTCVYFGVNRLFTRVGFPALFAMFVIACVISFLLRHVNVSSGEEG